MTPPRGLLALSLFALVSFAPSVAAADPPADGRWVLSGGQEHAIDARNAAIERTVDEMPLVVRPIARTRLEQQLAVPQHVVVRGGNIHVGAYAIELPEDGSWTRATDPDGNQVRARQVSTDGSISQLFRTEDGTLRYTMRFEEDELVLRVRLSSDRLPRPITFRLRFHRAG